MSPVYAGMENILDKLKCLSYSNTFTTPITRTHFALPGPNPSIQFQEFLDLVVWLIARIKRNADFFSIDKYDDPNTSVNKMMLALRSLDYAAEFPAAKLKAASGEAVVEVLEFLTTKALEAENFTFDPPKRTDLADLDELPDDDVDDEADIDDDIEVFEEDIPAYHSAADEVETVRDETQKIIESRVDPIEWKTELERVGPRLRISNAVGGKEWRSHIDQTKKHSSLIENELPSTEATLRTINNQLETAVDRMRTKEKYVNSQYSSLVQEYQDIRSDMKSIEDTYQSSNSKVTSLQNDLAAVAEQLSDIKGTMDSRGSSMTDTSPLVKIKAALQDIKVEIGHFELRIGVVAHTLLSAQASSVGQENSGVIIDGDDDDDDDDYEP